MTPAEAMARPRCTCGHIIDVHAAMAVQCLGFHWDTPCDCKAYTASETQRRG